MLLTIALLIGAVIFIIAYLIISNISQDEQRVHERLRGMAGAENEAMEEFWHTDLNKSLQDRLFTPVLEAVARRMKQLTPPAIYAAAEKDIEHCNNFQGRGMNGFLFYIFGLLFISLFLVYWYASSHTVGGVKLFFMVVGSFAFSLGFPFIVLKSMVAERQEAIRRAMPDVLDLLCVSVQAGLGFDGAMGKVTAKMKGPLIEECDKLLQELRMGVTRRNALLRLSERCGIKEMQLFVAALIQAEKLGVGLAQVLEVQSENMRDMRRQNAREKAAKLATKILFPTLIFIFPVLFVVALGPPLVSILKAFAK